MIVLVNPRARGVLRDGGLTARLRDIAGEVVVFDEAASIAERLAQDNETLVALCGGDGTGRAVLTALEPAYRARGLALPRVALLRGGTINTVTRNLGIRGTPESLLQRLCDRVRAGAPLPTVQHTLLRVNDSVGFLFAAALGARFLERYYERPTPGHAVTLAMRVALSALVGGKTSKQLFAPAHVRMTLDDETFDLDARLLVASTIPEVGVGMRITPRALDRPARFQLVASALTPVQMALQIPAVQAGRALHGTPHVDRVCRTATLVFEHDEPYTLDGDLFHARTITLAAAGSIQLVRV